MRLLVLIVALSSPCWSSIALVSSGLKVNCASGASTCGISISPASGTGHLLIACSAWGPAGVALTSLSSTNNGTWNTDSGSMDTSTNKAQGCGYVLSSVSGDTVAVCTLASNANVQWSCGYAEYSTTTSGFSFDTSSFVKRSASTNPVGVTLSPSGSNDVIIQAIRGNATTAVSGAYTDPANFGSASGFTGRINTNDGTAPTFTQTSSIATISALAFKEASAAGLVRSSGTGWH